MRLSRRRLRQAGGLPLSGVFYLALAGSLAVVSGGALALTTALHAQRTGTTVPLARFAERSQPPGAGQPAPGSVVGRAGAGTAGAATAGHHLALGHVKVSTAMLPGSSIVSEPSLALDSKGTIFVTAPTGLGHSPTQSTSPLWRSSDGGATWQGPTSTETGGQAATGVGGGDSDIVIDAYDEIFITSLWLGDVSMSVSSDGGNSFTELPVGHLTPLDDRPWLTYDPSSDSLWMDYDGFESLRVAKALLNPTVNNAGAGRQPATGLVFAQNVPAEPNETARNCNFCPPGTIAVDPSGNVWVAYVAKDGSVAVAESAAGQSTPTGVSWTATEVPGSGSGATNDSNSFQVLRSDAAGNLYLVWSQNGSSGGPAHVFLSSLQAGASAWSAPLLVSTTASAVFGTLAVVAPGSVDVAYYGSNYPGDHNGAPDNTQWDVYLAQVQNLFSSPSTLTADVLPGFHTGKISTMGATCASNCPDRSLGDFFSIAVDRNGMADIITTAGSATDGTKLAFVHQSGPIQPVSGASPAVLGTPYSFTMPYPQFQPGAGYYPSGGNSGSGNNSTPQPTSNAGSGSNAAGGDLQQAQVGNTSHRYPNGVPLDAVPPSRGAGPLPGPPLWVYGLLSAGALLGRFALRRLRS